MNNDVINPDFTRDIQESDIPQNVLEILLKDRTTGRNILWMTDGYEQFESVFGVKMGLHDEIVADVLSRPGNKVIRPRVDKKPIVAPKNTVCSQTFIYAKFDSANEANNFDKYLKTKLLRFLVSALKNDQHAPSKVYAFVPLQDFTAESDIDWALPIPDIDAQLYRKYGILKEDQEFIESRIKPME